VLDPVYPVPGAYYTAEELADIERVHEHEHDSVPFGAIHAIAEEPADDEGTRSDPGRPRAG
jgi:hypothetical protein